MKAIFAVVLSVLLVLGATPARADFQYTDTSKITGGTMKSMMKAVGIFSRQASQAMKPVTTTHYVKGNKLRTDHSDGTVRIIDLDARHVIEMDTHKKTYSQATFEEIKAAIKKAQEDAAQKAKQNPQHKGASAKLNAKISVTPGTGSREILGLATHETKVKIEMEMEAQENPEAGKQAGAPASGTVITSIDSWVTPKIPGHEELVRFYQRMAKETDWVPPANIHVDARVSKSMEEVQKNPEAFKGMPLLQYMTMSMAAQGGAAPGSAPDKSSADSSRESASTSASGAVVKGLGGLFGRKKKKEEAEAQDSKNPPPPADPHALIEMTIEVTSFSSDALNSSLFEVPAGYTRVQPSPEQILGNGPKQ